MIHSAITVLDNPTSTVGRTVTVPRKSGRQAYSVLAVPLRRRIGSFGTSSGLALVMISDPDRQRPIQPAELSHAFDSRSRELASSAT